MWTANLFQVTTGNIGPRLNFESVSWSIELNGIESINLKLKKSDLPSVNLDLWLAPWWAGVVLFWNGTPIVAGPIISRPNESMTDISVSCGGIRSVLARRFIVHEQSNWDNLNKSIVSYKGLSLGTIAKEVVKKAQMKPAGSLPISYAIPDETVVNDADHERNYRGFNLQNLTCHDVLTKLSNVINGPDILFRPKLVRDNQLTFEMWHGTEKQPRIFQKQTPVWDTTPEKGDVADVSTITTGSYQTFRVYSLGAGQDEGTLIKVLTNEGPLQQQFPLLETAINVGNSENPVIVSNHGLSNLWYNKESLLEIQMSVRADSGISIGNFWPGDVAHINMKNWLSLPNGITPMRILSITGDESNTVKVSLQKEDKFISG